MICIPQLSCNPDVLSIHTALANAFSNFSFIAVNCRAVDVSISTAQRGFNGSFNFVWLRLPGPKAYGRDLGAVVQRKGSIKCHL